MEAPNCSAVFLSGKTIKVGKAPVRKPGPGHVQLKMHSSGVCGTDIHTWVVGSDRPDWVLGHEPSGTVCALGEGVKHLKIGDRVAVEPVYPCYSCGACGEGQKDPEFFSRCSRKTCVGLNLDGLEPVEEGGMKEVMCHPENRCHKIPDTMSLEEAALAEPLAVGVRACIRGGNMQGKSVLVTGAGPIGLCGVIAAKALGATTIGMIDYARRFPAENDRRLQNRLRAATSCGADCNIIAGLSDKPGSVKKIHEAMGGPPDIVIENTGNDKLIPITAASLAYGGVMVITGISMPVGDVIASITDVVFREVDIRGSLFYPADFSSVVDMIGSGRCNVKQLITHRFPLEKAPEAFQLVRHGGIEETLTKVLVQCDDTF